MCTIHNSAYLISVSLPRLSILQFSCFVARSFASLSSFIPYLLGCFLFGACPIAGHVTYSDPPSRLHLP
jgi:hypothetical protein